MKKSQESKQKIHFIGIGGIGVSALARYFLSQGAQVSGSDVAESEILEDLRKLGAKIFIGHRKENLTHGKKADLDSRFRGNDKIIDLVVYSAAVRDDNPELIEARRRGIECQTYAQALGELTKKYFTIAVSGTHGKSTTTAMIGLILEAAGLDPTVIVGTKVKWQEPHPNPLLGKERGKNLSNFRLGQSKYLVIEADEYAASFFNYWPKIIVLTNIEEDHLDYYRDLNHIMETFAEYISHLRKDGVLVANEEDANISKIKNPRPRQAKRDGQKSKLQCKVQNYDSKLKIDGLRLKLRLKVPGKHNLSNAAAAITVARLLKIPDDISVKTLNNFTGTWRRMEYKGEINGAKIYDDYGHHPTEIRATLSGARELLTKNYKLKTKNQLWCVFQPHQYQRTHQLFNKFVGAFADADKVILLPIYSVAGREKEEIKKKVNSEILSGAIKRPKDVLYLNSFNKTVEYLKKNLKEGDICIIMGAGDIYKLTGRLLDEKIMR